MERRTVLFAAGLFLPQACSCGWGPTRKSAPVKVDERFAKQFKTSVNASISNGCWIVFFFRKTCDPCIRSISSYDRLAAQLEARDKHCRVALIELPSDGTATFEAMHCLRGKLREADGVPPMTIIVNQGIVTSRMDSPYELDLLFHIFAA